MATVSFTVPDEKVNKILDAFIAINPIPFGTDGEPMYTRVQWFKEQIKKHVINTVHRYDRKLSLDTVVIDNDLIGD